MSIPRKSVTPQGIERTSVAVAIAKEPQNGDLVMGGKNPLSTAAVLGGQEKYLARLFDLFNTEAKCDLNFCSLAISAEVELWRWVKASPLDDLSIKALNRKSFDIDDGTTYAYTFWDFAGRLKHGGALFTPATATYDPMRCEKKLRGIAYQALLAKAREMGGVK